MPCYNIRPEDWVRESPANIGVDTCKMLGIRYIGDEASGLVTIAATTNDFTFEHGDLSSEAADATVGATGVVDLTVYLDIELLIREINSSPNWEAWAVDMPGDFLTNYGAGTGVFIVASPWDAAVQAKVAAGIFPLLDTSLVVIEEHGVGVTFNGPTSGPHGFDANVLHEILQINATATFTGSTDGVYIYECDDRLGTKTQVAHYDLVSATATEIGNGIEPLISSKGRRLAVVIKDASSAITSPSLQVIHRSYAYGPGARIGNLLSAQ